VPGLFWSGVLVHAFGLVHAVLAAITLVLIGKFNYSAPVLQLQKHMATLRRVYAINAIACSAPWAVMWVPVLATFIGLNPANAALPWLQLNLILGVSGALFIYALAWFVHRRTKREGRESGFLGTSNAIRRSRELLGEIAEFERG
jgi:hypothetical protein